MDTESIPYYPSITLVGIGGLGTALLPLLYRLQPESLMLWDDDRISEENLLNQFFWKKAHVGEFKALRAAKWFQEQDIFTLPRLTRHRSDPFFDRVVIAAVDSLESRRSIWRGVQESEGRVELLLDGRLSREKPFFLRLFAIDIRNPDACVAYEDWLTGDDAPDSGRRDRDMIAAPAVLAGFMTMSIIQWSRGDRLPWQSVWSGVDMSLTPLYL